jgi:hypothetical protein
MNQSALDGPLRRSRNSRRVSSSPPPFGPFLFSARASRVRRLSYVIILSYHILYY